MSFDRFANRYNELGVIQRQCAVELAAKAGLPHGLGIDLGAGTGFIQDAMPSSQLVQVDLSPAMLANAQGLRVACDGARLPFKQGAFDWGVSSMALQWIGVARPWLDTLAPNAPFWACIVLDGSLPELAQAREAIGQPSAFDLPDAEHWEAEFDGAKLTHETRAIDFASPKEALTSVRSLGAGGPSSGQVITRAQLQPFLATLGRQLTYQLLWVEGRK